MTLWSVHLADLGGAELFDAAGHRLGYFLSDEAYRRLVCQWANTQVSDEELGNVASKRKAFPPPRSGDPLLPKAPMFQVQLEAGVIDFVTELWLDSADRPGICGSR